MPSPVPAAAPTPAARAQCALILVAPDPPPGVSPWHLLRVAGVPHLERLVLSCWQAGVPEVHLLAPAGLRPVLSRTLGRLRRRQEGSVELATDWPVPEGRPPCSWLLLTADSVPSPALVARLARQPVAPGEAAVVCTDDPAWPWDAPPHLPALTARLEEHGLPGWRPVGLAKLSPEAWEEWQRWRRETQRPRKCLPHLAALLEAGLRRLEDHGRLLAVAAEPFSLTYLASKQDAMTATRRLAAGVSGSPWGEGWLESSLNRRLARALLPTVAAWPVLPTQITCLHLTLGLLAALLFLEGSYPAGVAGALLLPLVVVLDCLDGLVARLTFRQTRWGGFLDFYGDTLLNLIIFLSISVGLYRMSGNPLYLALLLPLTSGYGWCWWLTDPHRRRFRQPKAAAHPVVSEMTSRDFVYLVLVFAVLGRLDWFIVGVAAGSHLFALFSHYLQNQLRNPFTQEYAS